MDGLSPTQISKQLHIEQKLHKAKGWNVWSPNANIIFMQTGKPKVDLHEMSVIAFIFFDMRCTKFVVVHGETIGYLNFLERKFYTNVENSSEISINVFNEKLINLKGYRYKVAAFDQYPRLQLINGRFKGVDKMFLETIATKQNATFHIESYGSKLNSTLSYRMVTAKLDLLLNTRHNGDKLAVHKILKPVLTYDENAWCALIPVPSKVSYLKFLLTPFDTYVWIFLFVSLVSAGLV